jgi:hypothetical protein
MAESSETELSAVESDDSCASTTTGLSSSNGLSASVLVLINVIAGNSNKSDIDLFTDFP